MTSLLAKVKGKGKKARKKHTGFVLLGCKGHQPRGKYIFILGRHGMAYSGI